jgi:hypothetical protein
MEITFEKADVDYEVDPGVELYLKVTLKGEGERKWHIVMTGANPIEAVHNIERIILDRYKEALKELRSLEIIHNLAKRRVKLGYKGAHIATLLEADLNRNEIDNVLEKIISIEEYIFNWSSVRQFILSRVAKDFLKVSGK